MLIIRRSNCINTTFGIVFSLNYRPVCTLRRNHFLLILQSFSLNLSSTQQKPTPHNTDYAWTSEDDFDLSHTEKPSQKREWQTTRHKRKIINLQKLTELTTPIKTNSRFESVNDLPCDESWRIKPPTPMDSTPTKREPWPPPIYIYDVNNYKAMVDDLSKAVEEETYHTIALSNNTIKVIPNTHTHTRYI